MEEWSAMDKRAQLQFRRLTADAQRSAIRRLALRGLSDEEIAQETGWFASDIRRVLEPPIFPDLLPWAMQRPRRQGSSGNRQN